MLGYGLLNGAIPEKNRRLLPPEIQDGGRKTDAAITFDQLEITMLFQRLPLHFLPGPT